MRRVTAVVVNWNSGDDLAGVVVDLDTQVDVDLSIVVVDNDSRDGSVEAARATGVAFELVEAGRNLGYTGGNNLGAEFAGPAADLLVVNPDVRLPHSTTVARLAEALAGDSSLAAVAPAIEIAPDRLEYLGSELDLNRAVAIHTQTDVAPPATSDPIALSWIDGAVLLVRSEARQEIGFFDDRFFLIYDEVDWCIRATRSGWRVALCPAVRVLHQRSSSFGTSQKHGYYFWRNLYLVCRLHAPSRLVWRLHYAKRFFRFVLRPVILRSGYALVVAHGAFDALRGRVGPGPQDVT